MACRTGRSASACLSATGPSAITSAGCSPSSTSPIEPSSTTPWTGPGRPRPTGHVVTSFDRRDADATVRTVAVTNRPQRWMLIMADPTIVLVHGAFADASSWRRLYAELAGDGLMIKAPPNPLRGVTAGDAEYTKCVIEQVEGPVLLVGHSYGGAVITAAGGAAHPSRPVNFAPSPPAHPHAPSAPPPTSP